MMGLLAVALLAAVAGCGDKGKVPTSIGSNQSTRQIAAGDKFVYDVTLTELRKDGSVVASRSGTVTVDVRKGTKHAKVPARIKRTFHVAETMEMNGAASGDIIWMGQDDDGAVYFLGRLGEGSEWALLKGSKPRVDVPAVLTEKTSWDYTTHMTNGDEKNKGKVIKAEKVETAAGELEAYKATTEGVTSEGNAFKGYMWLRPEFPLGVKSDQMVTSKRAKTKLHIVQTLKSYKFAE